MGKEIHLGREEIKNWFLAYRGEEMQKERLIEILRSYLPLCRKGREWGGYINLLTGEIEGPFEGEIGHFSCSAKKERVKREQGWVMWHSHSTDNRWDVLRKKILGRVFGWRFPAGDEPSPGDLIGAHFAGGPCYVLTNRGIWEVTPLRVFPVNEVAQRVGAASAKAIAEAKKLGFRPNNPNDQRWQNLAKSAIQGVLPTKVTQYDFSPSKQKSRGENESSQLILPG